LLDGPVQLVALALLKLDGLRQLVGRSDIVAQPQANDVETIRSALNETLRDMRRLCARVLPSKIERLSLTEVIRLGVLRHQHRSGALVQSEVGDLPSDVPVPLKACVYRLLEDVLGDALTGCSDCRVRATYDGNVIEITILTGRHADGLCPADSEQSLANSRDRVEAMGGMLLVGSYSGGTLLTARFELYDAESA
jgi:signal transduction histidine kinase